MDTAPRGFLHDKTTVKVVILYILARIDTPLSRQEIYELAYQDDSLNYFDFSECLPELVSSGHLTLNSIQRYSITEKGRAQGAELEDSVAVPIVQKVSAAIAQKRNQLRRDSNITVSARQDAEGQWISTLSYRDDNKPLMTLSLLAPNEPLAESMAENLRKQADLLYKQAMEIATASGSRRRDSD